MLPFGLSPALYVFTKMMRPLIKRWRGHGIRCVIYIDDGIHGAEGKERTAYNCLEVREDLESAGFTINEEKSCLYPSQTGEWLGFTIDAAAFTLSVPSRKLEKFFAAASDEILRERTTSRNVSKIAGQLISMGPGIGPLSRLFTRKMYQFVFDNPSWDQEVRADRGAREEIRFWLDNLDKVNGYRIQHTHAFSKIVYSDASDHSYGGYIAERLGNVIARGSFSDHQIHTSSTYRELLAVREVLLSLVDYLRHESVLWHSDNWNVAKILQVGSSKRHLQELALQIFAIRVRNDINIVPCWVPREENGEADAISKYRDSDDWGIDYESFGYIQTRFGHLDIDRFADSKNNKLPRFDSRYHCPGCETVNTFTANWSGDFNWLCPPICLIGDTLKHARLCKARGVLLVPEWPSAYYWPLLTSDGKTFNSFVTDVLVMDPYYVSKCETKTVFQGFAPFRSLALLIRF